ncbi:DUF4249 domain-containing protein [Pedobacter sp. BAL39]|uniref:DUF4249 domain-containing protein n=1 Tax=Pedobacter sp. BAL39 TaxID=391596 RepID=UPI000304600F|nr:DUF4249 domain-containing protein [Pedobacter sp. BAL39]
MILAAENIKIRCLVRLLYAVTAMVLFGSCEKVIELDLKNADPVVVIDGGVSDFNGNQVVRVSRTYEFTEPNRFNGAAGAKVVLTNDAGMTWNYTEVSTGVYQSTRFRGRPGITYTLDVTLDGKTYTASSKMPEKVILDSLTFKQFDVFGSISSYIAVNYNDPPGIQNQYRNVLRAKGKVEDDSVNEDRFDDGNKVSNVIFYELDELMSGDSVRVEFQCIDRNVYKYFYSMGQNSGSGGPPVSPSNPPTNFSNGALGVFSAYTSSTRVAIIK